MKKVLHQVKVKMEEHNYMEGVSRSIQRIQATAEIFTPTELVIEILNEVDLDIFGAGKNVLDPACGDGQFLVAIKWVKILQHKMKEKGALSEIYGVDIMRDNVDVCRARLGGGNIIMGNSLKPDQRLNGQTKDEHEAMKGLFADQLFTTRIKKRNKSAGPNNLTLFSL